MFVLRRAAAAPFVKNTPEVRRNTMMEAKILDHLSAEKIMVVMFSVHIRLEVAVQMDIAKELVLGSVILRVV